MLELSHRLSCLPDLAAYRQAARAELSVLLPGDDLFWSEVDYASGVGRVECGPAAEADPQLGAALAAAIDHPSILSYVGEPADLSPRRVSDVVCQSSWRGTAAYALLGQRMGRHQLSLVVRLSAPSVGYGWSVGRAGRDFSDTERDLAAELLPLLTAYEALYGRLPTRPDEAAGEAAARYRLTERELDVLSLVADGLTAGAIGRVRRISAATVRKHLEHTYAKLDCHDRLVAVHRARQAGLLPATSHAAGWVGPPLQRAKS